jgi:hypothetical protein
MTFDKELEEYIGELSYYNYVGDCLGDDEPNPYPKPVRSEQVQQQLDSCGYTLEELLAAVSCEPDIDGLGECGGGGAGFCIEKHLLPQRGL